jgi:hypothetical protein
MARLIRFNAAAAINYIGGGSGNGNNAIRHHYGV